MIEYHPHIKRWIDIFFSLFAILFLSPLLILISVLICIDSKGSPFFIQKRIGKGNTPFRLIKFRSMVNNEIDEVRGFSPGDSSRVTRIGRLLRSSKIDELPELFNIIKGEMSFVGPRPEVAKYVNAYLKDYEYILTVRPGLSDYASIKYLDEERVLADQADPEKYYWNVILPDKIRLAKNYVEKLSFRIDMSIVTHTLKSVLNITNKRK